jgi:DNA-binding MarR family transcriptional regulator
MNSDARHELSLLEALTEDAHVTQRNLSAKLGMALGLTNIYLKRLVRKGYIKCVNVRSNRLSYLITPSGIAEKTRLTYEFMDYSLQLYKDARIRIRAALAPVAARQSVRLAIYRTGEAAEIAYLCLKECGVEPVVVFTDHGDGHFFSIPVRPISGHSSVTYDALIVAAFDDTATRVQFLERLKVPREKLVLLRAAANEGSPA